MFNFSTYDTLLNIKFNSVLRSPNFFFRGPTIGLNAIVESLLKLLLTALIPSLFDSSEETGSMKRGVTFLWTLINIQLLIVTNSVPQMSL